MSENAWQGVGSIIARAFRIYFGKFAPFTILTVIVYSPILALQLLAAVGIIEYGPLWSAVESLASIVLNFLVTGALTFGVVQHLRGRQTGVGECLRVGGRRLNIVGGAGLTAGILVVLGGFLLVVPGVIVMCINASPRRIFNSIGPGFTRTASI